MPDRPRCDPGQAPDPPRLDRGSRRSGRATLFLREVVNCPIVIYCEYYFAISHRDISYRIDLPPAEPAPFFPRCINAPTLVTLVDCDAGYSATHWQKSRSRLGSTPRSMCSLTGSTRIFTIPAPRPDGSATLDPAGTRVVTFVSRGLESIRGFDLFMKVAHRIAQARSDVHLRRGRRRGDPLRLGQAPHRLAQLQAVGAEQENYDLSRFMFLGRILPEQLADILRISDLHIYLTAPFVLSWSLLNAMASGCVVLGSDVPPVREVIERGKTAWSSRCSISSGLTETALRVLDDPAEFAPLGRAARANRRILQP